MAWEGALISAVGSLAGAGLSYMGGQMNNAANSAQSQQQYNWQDQLLNKQIDYNMMASAGQWGQNVQNMQQAQNFADTQAKYGREFNHAEAGYARDFNWAQMQAQNQFQSQMFKEAQDYNREMSSTAYQRATQDMRLAGLNPILAYRQGGASAPQMSGPSGGSASSPMASGSGASSPGVPSAGSLGVSPGSAVRAEMRDAITPAISTAFQGLRAIQGVEQIGAQIENVRADTDVRKEQAHAVRAETALNTARSITEAENPERVRSEVSRNLEQASLHRRQRYTEERRPALVDAQAASAAASARQTGLEADALQNWGRRGPLQDLGSAAEGVATRIGRGLMDLWRTIR